MQDRSSRSEPPGQLVRALIVEDEPLGYRRLLEVLGDHDDVEVVGWASCAETAIEAVRRLSPNLIFLDIEMPGSSGLEVVRSLGSGEMPMIVFVTAHAEHAVEAFEIDAVDYLLKPYSNERVEESLDRVRRALASGSARPDDDSSGNRTRERDREPPGRGSTTGRFLSRVAVSSRGKMKVVPVSAIDRIEAEGVYASLHVGADTFLVRESLTALEEKLDPEDFCRIHRSAIVALDRVESYNRGGGTYFVQLTSGARLSVGRSYRKELERRLGCF
jgi:two-component system, LytTR family, response regulator